MIPHFRNSLLRMNFLSHLLRRDLMRAYNRSLHNFNDPFEDSKLPEVDENTYYSMRVASNDNGHVKVKTILKEPGKDWNVAFKEYDKGKAIEQEQSQKKVEAIDEAKDTKSLGDKEVKDPESSMKEKEMKSAAEMTQKAEKQEAMQESPLDEFQSVFDSMEKDFENSFRRNFEFYEPQNEKEVAKGEGEKSLKKPEAKEKDQMFLDPFEAMEGQFEEMERNFESIFGRSFGFYDPFFPRRRARRTQQIKEQEKDEKLETSKSNEASKTENKAV